MSKSGNYFPNHGVHIWKMTVGITFYKNIALVYRFVLLNKNY